MQKILIVPFVILCFLVQIPGLSAQEDIPTPLPAHCRRVGPMPLPLTDLPEEFCGCTWGIVYHRGQPIDGVGVQLHFDDLTALSKTKYHTDFPDYPYYVASGLGLGAQRSDLLTLTVDFAGETLTRPFRALPATTGDSEGEQEVPLVLTEQGEWTPLLTDGYTRTVLLQEQTLWMGGPAGLAAVDLATGTRIGQPLPGKDAGVVALATSPNGTLWAAGPQQVAFRDEQQWQTVTLPFVHPVYALAIEPATGALWVGGENGTLARYDGKWEVLTVTQQPVTALTVDNSGHLWVGTWGSGVYHRTVAPDDVQNGWQQYRIGDGLASDYIYSAVATQDAIWFGTHPYVSPQGPKGGISRYSPAEQTWYTYTTAHGLPADAQTPAAPAPIYTLTAAPDGLLWAGTTQGVHLLATPFLWITDDATASAVRAITSDGPHVIAAQTNGSIQHLDRTRTPGLPPTAQLTVVNDTITLQETLSLTGTAQDPDDDDRILAWDWRSDVDGPLCTTAESCDIPAALLSPGLHTVTLRVQDDEGVWSAPVTTTVEVRQQLFLPTVMR